MELLPIDWYFQPPIDFEHKEYVLYAYLQKVDDSFLNKKLSPHLLHLEKLLKDLQNFKDNSNLLLLQIEKRNYIYLPDNQLDNFKNDNVNTIFDIVDFSIPQINNRLLLGQRIFQKYKQILY